MKVVTNLQETDLKKINDGFKQKENCLENRQCHNQAKLNKKFNKLLSEVSKIF